MAIDAIKFRKGSYDQFHQEAIDRELMKAYAGFSSEKVEARIITGGWGCGVYNGDILLKIIIQWIAASMSKKSLVICPFGNNKTLNKSGLVKMLQDHSVGSVYSLLLKAGSMKNRY